MATSYHNLYPHVFKLCYYAAIMLKLNVYYSVINLSCYYAAIMLPLKVYYAIIMLYSNNSNTIAHHIHLMAT